MAKLTIGTEKKEFKNVRDAVQYYLDQRDTTGMTGPEGVIKLKDRRTLRVSFNGRVWTSDYKVPTFAVWDLS